MLYDELYATTNSTVLAGGVAGGINTVISCPQDVLKSRLQMQIVAGAGAYKGPIKTTQYLFRKYGASVFYRGWRPLVMRDTLAYAVLFSIFFKTKESGAVPVWLCGGLSGVGFYMSTLPIDRIKTVMMTQSFSRPEYSSAWQCFRDLYTREGITGMYRGCLPTLARTFCGQAVALTVFDKATNMFRGRLSS